MTERDKALLENAYFQTDFGLERIAEMSRERLLEAYCDLFRDRDAWKGRARAAGFDMESLHP